MNTTTNTTDRSAILAAAAARRAMRIREGVKLGTDGQPTPAERTKARAERKGAAAPKDRTPARVQLTDEQLAAIITELKAANPTATASSMIDLIRKAGHKCNGGRIRATFWAVTGQSKGRVAKATDGASPVDTEAAKEASHAKARRTEQAKVEKLAEADAKAQGLKPGDEGWPATPALDELRAEHERNEAERAERARRELAEAEAAEAAKPKRTRKTAEPKLADEKPADEVAAKRAAKAPKAAAKAPKLVEPLPKGKAPAKRTSTKAAKAAAGK